MRWLVAVGILVSVSAQAQTTQFRAPNGNLLGSESWENGGSRLVFRQPNGNPDGYWTEHGNRWEHRANNGNLLGTATTLPK